MTAVRPSTALQHRRTDEDLTFVLDEMTSALAKAAKRSTVSPARPMSANDLRVMGGCRSMSAPQVLSTKGSAPAFSFGNGHARKIPLDRATSPGPVYAIKSTLGSAAVSFGTAEQRPRTAGQTRFSHHSTVPGPASYGLPSSIGTAMALSRMRSSRASGFGTAPARLDLFTLSNQTPGAKYRLPQGVTREGRQRNLGATWSNAPKYATSETKAAANSPGPGSYSRNSSVGCGNVESTLRNQPAIGFGTASRNGSDFAAVALRRSKDLPGAASYTLPSTLGRQLLSEKSSSRCARFAQGDRFKPLAVDETFLDGMGYGARRRRKEADGGGGAPRERERRRRPCALRTRTT
jgi:hypothetical protein